MSFINASSAYGVNFQSDTSLQERKITEANFSTSFNSSFSSAFDSAFESLPSSPFSLSSFSPSLSSPSIEQTSTKEKDAFVMAMNEQGAREAEVEEQAKLTKARATEVGAKVSSYWDAVDSYEEHDYASWLPENYAKYKEMDDKGQLSGRMRMVFDALGSDMPITDEAISEGVMAISNEQELKLLPPEKSLKEQLSAKPEDRDDNVNEAERKLAEWKIAQDLEILTALEGTGNTDEFEDTGICASPDRPDKSNSSDNPDNSDKADETKVSIK